jgi:hypothetical protein
LTQDALITINLIYAILPSKYLESDNEVQDMMMTKEYCMFALSASQLDVYSLARKLLGLPTSTVTFVQLTSQVVCVA